MAISVTKLSEYLNHGLNLYLTGEAGTGKTQMLKAAAALSGLKLGYMSAPTLDAYVDLVGIPVAEYSEVLKKKVLEFIRKKDFLDIEILFIDELPRGELKTLNAIFEIVQFGTINGEIAMPNLKAVVAAGNPLTDDYTGQQQVDYALLDRFDFYIETEIIADPAYFARVFGKEYGDALTKWHKLHDHKAKGYLSPRRLEKIGHTWLLMPDMGTLKGMVPPNGDFDVSLLQKSLSAAVKGTNKLKVDPSQPLEDRISFMSAQEIRNAKAEILDLMPKLDREPLAKVTEAVARALAVGIRVDAVIRDWGTALTYFSTTDKTSMMNAWRPDRTADFLKKIDEAKIQIGSELKR